MHRRIGPILHLRQGAPGEWRFSVGLWVEGAVGAPLTLRFDAAAQARVGPLDQSEAPFGGARWVHWDVVIPRAAGDRRTHYRIEGLDEGPIEFDHVVVPAQNQTPRIAFFSCNGVQDPRDWTTQPEMEALWGKMRRRHERPVARDKSGGPYHVLLGGGDQIYCDAVWKDVPGLAALDSWKKRKALKPLPPALVEDIEKYYACFYARWGRSWFGEMQARVPGLYTWDDHDIFDGWGSYDDALQRCDVFEGIFATARRAFELFQLGGSAAAPGSARLDSNGDHFLQAMALDDSLDVLLLDVRSQRKQDRVMAESQWKALKAYLEARAARSPAGHLLVVSPIPVVYLNFAAAKRFLDWLPGRQELEDDLADHWESPAHQQERARLIMTLLDHAAATRSRVTILSGDVHVGARGRIVSQRPSHLLEEETEATIHQLTSSAIVFKPPKLVELVGMRAISGEGPAPLLAVSNVSTEVVPVGGRHFLLGDRNWLSIEPESTEDGLELWARWITEAGDVQPPLVVHPRGLASALSRGARPRSVAPEE